jgi:dihydroneopterin aldolase
MQTEIFVNRLRLYARHGVLPQERRVGAWFTIDLRVGFDLSRAMASDRLDDTVSYAELCQTVAEQMAVPSALLEHVAGRIVAALRQRWPALTTIDLSIAKDNPPMSVACGGAGIHVYDPGMT